MYYFNVIPDGHIALFVRDVVSNETYVYPPCNLALYFIINMVNNFNKNAINVGDEMTQI